MKRLRLAEMVAQKVREWIESGQMPPGFRLKSEQEFAGELGVSRTTLREALRLLEEEGLVTRHQGIGTFVNPNSDSIRAGIERLEGFTQTIRRAGHRAEDRVVGIEPLALPPEVARCLQVEPATAGYRIRSVRLSDGVPVIYCRDYLAARALPSVVDVERRRSHESLLEFFREVVGTRVAYAILTIQAMLPDAETAEALQMKEPSPLVLLEGPAFSDRDRPLYYSWTVVRSEHYRFTLVRR